MPLLDGSSDDVIARNARELMDAGHPEDQAWAIAYKKAGRSRAPMAKAILFFKARPDGWKKPTPAQAAAGNYKKPRMKWHGLDIAIENPKGTVREGVDETGKAWRTEFKHAYGEVSRTEGADGDPVDVFIGPDPDGAPEVYVVRQMRRKKWDEYDEDKCMIGFPSIEAAKQAYLNHYDDPRFFGSIVAMPRDEFIEKVRATRERPGMVKSMVLFFRLAP